MPNLNALSLIHYATRHVRRIHMHVILEQTNLKVKLFTFRSQELPLKKQTPGKIIALTGCFKSNSTMT